MRCIHPDNAPNVSRLLDDPDFPSYWTLVRKEEYPIEFGSYKIYKVKHY
ncbi:hypothetical protein ACFO5O_11915 [Geojedonia litorea]|uniref:Uncharacterized protein n=1 Tax=Geojedonia litorea TaxID=1268269 RepID=A0ABV9N3Y6_9FLAO